MDGEIEREIYEDDENGYVHDWKIFNCAVQRARAHAARQNAQYRINDSNSNIGATSQLHNAIFMANYFSIFIRFSVGSMNLFCAAFLRRPIVALLFRGIAFACRGASSRCAALSINHKSHRENHFHRNIACAMCRVLDCHRQRQWQWHTIRVLLIAVCTVYHAVLRLSVPARISLNFIIFIIIIARAGFRFFIKSRSALFSCILLYFFL